MSPTGHLAIGFMAKKYTPKVPVIILLPAAYLIDILYFVFIALKIESAEFCPWSHSLLMALVWSALTLGFTLLITKKFNISLVLGLLVFSHWALDFIVWNNLPVAFNKTITTGLGLYNYLGMDPANLKFDSSAIIPTLLELGLMLCGLVMYIRVRKKMKKIV